jgi:hypothetical protein
LGVGKKRIASVDNHVAFFEKRCELVDDRVHRRAGFDHDHRFPWALEGAGELLHRARRLNVFPLRFPRGEFIGHFSRPVEHSDRKSLRLHIEDKVLAHDSETNQYDITLIRVHFEYLLVTPESAVAHSTRSQ